METLSLPHYQEKGLITVRPMTREEGKAIQYGATLEFISKGGDIRYCRPNGKVRTWKRDPERVQIPVKYGFRECGTFEWNPMLQRYVTDSAAIYLVKRV